MNRNHPRTIASPHFARKFLPVLAAAFAACATPAVVFIGNRYDPSRIHRVALLSFVNYPGVQGSGEIAAATFEKYLLWGDYNLVERRQVAQILQEQSFSSTGAFDPKTIRSIGKLLGVDALVLGSLTEFSNPQSQTVMVDMPQEQTEPIYGKVVTVQHAGDTTIKTEQRVVTGYTTTEYNQVVPETETVPAQVGISVRLVDVQTGEILWNGSATSDGVSLTAALEQASAKIMQAIVEKLKKSAKTKTAP